MWRCRNYGMLVKMLVSWRGMLQKSTSGTHDSTADNRMKHTTARTADNRATHILVTACQQSKLLIAPFTRISRIRTGEDNGKPADGLGALDVAHAQALTNFDRTRDLTAQRHLAASIQQFLADYCQFVALGLLF